jgi:lactoylglutathione lyase
MNARAFFKAVGPIGDTDVNALPVKFVDAAIGFYTRCLGFTLISKDQSTARLRRDDVEIALAENGRDPDQASCWFAVSDVDALWSEYDEHGAGPGKIDVQTYDGHHYRAFFAREPYGVCFCFSQSLDQEGHA